MKITDDALVTIDVSMYDAQGNLLEQSDAPLTYLHGHGDIFAGIEQELNGKEVGAKVSVKLEPEDAFGDYYPELIALAPVEQLGEGVEPGMRVDGAAIGAPAGVYIITDIAEGMAVLDGNHPLAGYALQFEVTVVDVQEATDDQIEAAETTEVPAFLRIAEASGRTLH